MGAIHEKHMQLVDAVNEAKTEIEHRRSEVYLNGWRQGMADAGRELNLCHADLEQFDRGFTERPMCCGVFLDWEESK
jgi:hypothetical protein